jgi:hypothetical protein
MLNPEGLEPSSEGPNSTMSVELHQVDNAVTQGLKQLAWLRAFQPSPTEALSAVRDVAATTIAEAAQVDGRYVSDGTQWLSV